MHHLAKGVSADADPVTPDEDHALRAAFGRYGGSATARMAAMPVVARYQTLGAGRWFLCDCRPGVERRPALIPVALTHIRRHDAPPILARCSSEGHVRNAQTIVVENLLPPL